MSSQKVFLAGVALALGFALVIASWSGQPGRVLVVPSPSVLPSPTASATSPPPTPGITITPTPGAPGPIPPGYRVGVPRLGIDLPIEEGNVQRDVDLQRTPENFAFHLPGTAIPGQGSNTYLYAHARRGMFLALWDARIGDEVLIRTPDGRVLAYEVSQVHPRVPPTDTSWIQPTPTERVTLQTSTGPNPGDPRFVVVTLPKG